MLRRFSSFDTFIKNFTLSQKKFTIPFLTNTRTISQKLNKIHTKIQKRPPIFLKIATLTKIPAHSILKTEKGGNTSEHITKNQIIPTITNNKSIL